METKAASYLALCLFSSAAFAGAPAWVSGDDSRYPRQDFVIGVGLGSSREAADTDARAEISRVFESNVNAVQKDFMSAATAVNKAGKGVSVEVQSVSSFQQITSKKTLAAVDLREKAQDGDKFYTLALLSRNQCMGSLHDQIDALDQTINGHLARATGGDKITAFKAYGSALAVLDQREGLNAMLRVCDPRGKGVPPPSSFNELAAKFDEATGNLRLGIDLRGGGAGRVRDCLMESLGDKGYQITELQVDDEEVTGGGGADTGDATSLDVIIRGRLRSESAGELNGIALVRTELALRVMDPKSNKVLKTMTANRKEGRPTMEAAAALSAYRICLDEMPALVNAIDATFKR
jgi:hypothetical protein